MKQTNWKHQLKFNNHVAIVMEVKQQQQQQQQLLQQQQQFQLL